MTKVKIVTDSNSGITQAEAEKLGISVIPMPFLINGEEYFEDINLTQAEFYNYLTGEASVSTSQPAIGALSELWDEILKEYDEIIHIPMSSALSKSYETAAMLAKDYAGKVHVIDNQRISVTQKQSVLDALTLLEQGKTTSEVVDFLNQSKLDCSIYISLESLKYLKKGGRLTPAAAFIGTVLRIRPVLQIQGDKLDAFKKVHTLRQSKSEMIAAVLKDLQTRFNPLLKSGEMTLAIAHTNSPDEANAFKQEVQAVFPHLQIKMVDPLSLSVSCHIGPGAIALVAMRVVK